MWIRQELQVKLLSLYQRFERVIISILTALIAIIVLVAVWNLAVKVVFGLTLSESLDPSAYAIFQAMFGMIFVVIVALGLKKSLLVIAGRRDNVVQIRAVVLTALLAR
jgi:phosphotransferase system  glucose/maltose/N-acetylglucosamine-specific IIC component